MGSIITLFEEGVEEKNKYEAGEKSEDTKHASSQKVVTSFSLSTYFAHNEGRQWMFGF